MIEKLKNLSWKHIGGLVLIVIIIISISSKTALSNQAYFDLSDNEIEIQTNFNGKEVIIFGLPDPKFETVLVIKGPAKNIKVQKKIIIKLFQNGKIITSY